MWKPGTAKPNNAVPPKSQNTSSKSPKSGGGSNSGSSSAKKLSSSTMGMRFMQRKNEANKEQEERKAAMQAAAARRNNSNKNGHNAANDSSNTAGGRINLDRKRENDEISKEQSSAAYDGEIILELASVVDMYGVGSDVVGRRSFGGFHKAVRTTWDSALKKRTDEDERTRHTKNHITDEELLERYEKYVKGRSGGGEPIVGGGSLGKNRSRKEKRKRN